MNDDNIKTTILPQHIDALEQLKHDSTLCIRARHIEEYLLCVELVEMSHKLTDIRQWAAEDEEK